MAPNNNLTKSFFPFLSLKVRPCHAMNAVITTNKNIHRLPTFYNHFLFIINFFLSKSFINLLNSKCQLILAFKCIKTDPNPIAALSTKTNSFGGFTTSKFFLSFFLTFPRSSFPTEDVL